MIEIKNLSFSYKEKEIFHDLSVSFPSKGFVILLGRSGSGKTTLLSLLSHQLIPTKGEIIGIDEKHRERARIGDRRQRERTEYAPRKKGKTLHFLNELIDCLTVPFVFRAQYG